MLSYRRCGLLLLLTACLTPTESADRPRIMTFGDSNTDGGWQGAILMGHSYIEPTNPAPASAPNNPWTLAGMLDARGIPAVNHGISGTKSFSGRIANGAPNALEKFKGVLRFEAEVLGQGYPWDGGGTTPIPRLQAYQPGPCDYVYVSMGTNDGVDWKTIASLRFMITRWVAAGYSPRHFILTTLAPATGNHAIARTNHRIRQLAFRENVMLVDIAVFTSRDDGETWRSSLFHIGDGIHYTDIVRTWIANRVAEYVRDQGCN